MVSLLGPLEQEGSMVNPSAENITQLLQAWSRGDRDALDRLLPQVYGELHQLAHH